MGLNIANHLLQEATATPLFVAVLSANREHRQLEAEPALLVPRKAVLPTFAPIPLPQTLGMDASVPAPQVPLAVAAEAVTPIRSSSAAPRRAEADATMVSTAPPPAVAAVAPPVLSKAGVQFTEAPGGRLPKGESPQ